MAITISGSGIVEANLADNAVTLAKMASGTDGEILTYDASGNPTSVSVGTDGQVLTSTGVGSPPAFETAAGGGGKVLQVVSTIKADHFSSSLNSFVDVTGLSLNITPASTTSKILVILHTWLGNSTSSQRTRLKILRGSSTIGGHTGDSASGRAEIVGQVRNLSNWHTHQSHVQIMDSPASTSEQTYKVQLENIDTSGTTSYMNRTNSDSTSDYYSGMTTHFILMEIGA